MRTFLLPVVGALAIGLALVIAPARGQEGKPPAKKEEGKPAPKKLVLTVGSTHPLQMAKKQAIKTVINENPDVVRVGPKPDDPTTVLITALAPGRARVTLIGDDGKKETRDFGKSSDKPALTKR
jgi:hypothetical protein